jgi:hypothetical protein
MTEQLREVFFHSFFAFLTKETKNILDGTSERNLCSRLAMDLERTAHGYGYDAYYADPEYNRMQNGQVKAIIDEESLVISITCDLVLHSRGEVEANDNLIAIEMKKAGRPRLEKDSDRKRLRALTKQDFQDLWPLGNTRAPQYVCGYKLGFFIEIDVPRRQLLIEEYRAGEKTDEQTLGF